MSCWIGSVTSQTLTFMPAVTRPSCSQNAMNSPSSGLPRVTTVSAGPAEPRVLHAEVVLVGEEVRHPVVADLLPEHRPRGGRTAVERVGPVLDAHVPAVERVEGRRDVAGGEDVGRRRPQGVVGDDAVVDLQPGRRGEVDVRAPPRPPRRRRRPRARRRWSVATDSTRPSAPRNSRTTVSVNRSTPWSRCSRAKTRPISGPSTACSGVGCGSTIVTSLPWCGPRRRPRARSSRPRRSPPACRRRRSRRAAGRSRRTCAGSGRRRGRRPAPGCRRADEPVASRSFA